MASLFTFKECSSCGALHNKSCAYSEGGFVGKFVRDPNKTPGSSQRPPIFEKNYTKCGDPVDGLYCRQCALLRKKLREIFDENENFQDFLNTSESSNDNTNVVNAPQEPFKVLIISNPEPCNNQTVDELPQTLPSFDPTCYSGDGSSFTYDLTPNFVNDSPNVSNPPPQPPTYSYEFCGNDTYYGYDCSPQPPQYTINHPIFNAQNELLNSQNELMEQMTSICDMVGQYMQKKEEEKRIAEEQAAKARYWKIPICYDDDNDEESSIPLRDIIISELPPCVAITPVLSTEEPVDSLVMEDEHLDTISVTESDEVIKSSVENLA
ncbi:hypothetical protein Tco_0337239 [Tanacetum coccineum]